MNVSPVSKGSLHLNVQMLMSVQNKHMIVMVHYMNFVSTSLAPLHVFVKTDFRIYQGMIHINVKLRIFNK